MSGELQPSTRHRRAPRASTRGGRMTRWDDGAVDLRAAQMSLDAAKQIYVRAAMAANAGARAIAESELPSALDQAQLAADTLLALLARFGRAPVPRADVDDADAIGTAHGVTGTAHGVTEYQRSQKARYNRLREAGLCQTCAVEPRHPGSPWCTKHRAELAEKRRADASTARKVKS